MAKISFKGIVETMNNISDTVDQESNRVAGIVQEEAQRHTPIDKGRARRGWQKRTNNRGFIVSNTVPYIGLLEEGRSKQAPRGIIGPTLRALRSKL